MCKMKSVIVLKNRVFCPDYDSHDNMLKELKIKDDFTGASKKFVRVELSPNDGNVFSPVSEWVMKVDQDVIPEWFDQKADELRVREAVESWAKKHIFDGVNDLVLKDGKFYLKNSRAVLRENSRAELRENSSVIIYNYSNVKIENVTLKDSAVLLDYRDKKIICTGGWIIDKRGVEDGE